MKKNIIILIGIAVLFVQCVNKDQQKNEKTAEQEVWTSLFDGSNTDQWRDTKSEMFPEQGWVIDGDILTVLGKTEDHPAGHDIITKKMYTNFELVLEVRLTEGANSGVKYIVRNDFPENEGSFLGLEFQLLDNENHPDAMNGTNGNHKMASLYDLIPAPEDIAINPPGEWNEVRILVDGNKAEHWLNGKKIINFDRQSPEFKELVGLSKYKDLENFGGQVDGYLLLQGHGNTVSFRSIKIRTW